MTLHQLRIFLSVSKHLNVTQASQELHITQPAVSRQLKMLEDECNTKLYRVGSRGIQLTGHGRLLVSGAHQIMSQVERVKSTLRGGKTSSVLRIGESESLSLSSVPLLSVEFQRVCPGVQIKIRTATSRAIEQMVLNSEIEVAVVTNRSFHPLLNYEHFRQEKLVLFAAAKHPLARKPKLRPIDLGGVPLVIKGGGAEENFGLDQIQRKLEKEGMTPNVAMYCDSGWGVRAAVKAGLGLGILYHEMVAPDSRRGDLKIIKIMDLKMEVDSHIVFHREKPLSHPAQRFFEVLQGWQQKMGGGLKQLKLA